jgi:hypothetical protein
LQLRPFSLPLLAPVPRRLVPAVFVQYTSDVSDRFRGAYRPNFLTLFDNLLTKPYLRINRPPNETNSAAVATATLRSSSGALPTATSSSSAVVASSSAVKTSDYGRFLSAFASWVQGGQGTQSDLPKPLQNPLRPRLPSNIPLAPQQKSPLKDAVLQVNQNSLMKYAQ